MQKEKAQASKDYEESEVIRTWKAISAKFGNTTEFYNLSSQAQQVFIQGVNQVLVVASGQIK